jgi:hypothetical protein
MRLSDSPIFQSTLFNVQAEGSTWPTTFIPEYDKNQSCLRWSPINSSGTHHTQIQVKNFFGTIPRVDVQCFSEIQPYNCPHSANMALRLYSWAPLLPQRPQWLLTRLRSQHLPHSVIHPTFSATILMLKETQLLTPTMRTQKRDDPLEGSWKNEDALLGFNLLVVLSKNDRFGL